MTEYDEKEFLFHNSCISKFNEILYNNIFTEENICSKQKAIAINKDKFYGYYLEKNRNTYFMLSEHLDRLPFKFNKEETSVEDYKGDVFTVLLNPKSIKIPSELKMDFRTLVNSVPKFKHSNQKHFLIYNIVAYASIIDRINARISTDAGFGKDSIVSILNGLVGSTANLYGATFAKLEFVLRNKLIVLNEMGNLKGDDKINMQEFLLATGAYFDNYTKRTRKSGGTQEQYNISELSLLSFYNLPSYYTNKGQEYFDQMFTGAVTNRFIPFVFEGQLTTKFETLIDVDKIVGDNDSFYKDVIATINFFKENPIKEIKYGIDTTVIKFSETQGRYSRTFNTILKYISEYAESQEEFDDLSKELYSCYLKYEELTVGTKTTRLNFT